MKIATLVIFLSAGFLSAAPVPNKDLRKAVETWVRHATADRRPDAAIERVEPYLEDGVVAAYIVHLANGGYCLAGADSLVLPVYWYSPQGNFDPKNPGLREILGEIAGRQKHLKREVAGGGQVAKLHEQTLAKRAAFWADLRAGAVDPAASPAMEVATTATTLVLPLTSEWGQHSPYNDRCPAPTGSTNHTLVGCVATAAAQVMYYWRWPNTGVGSSGQVPYSFRFTPAMLATPLAANPHIPLGWGGLLAWNAGRLEMSGGWDNTLFDDAVAITNTPAYQIALANLWNRLVPGQTLHSANFGNVTYDWSLMHDTHQDPVDAGDREVAKLCYDVGLSAHMAYGLHASGAYTSDLAAGLRNNFRYDPDITFSGRDVGVMVEEIRWQRPILLEGSRPGTAHLWVVYGYYLGANAWQFKMNLGWGGLADGWYAVDTVPYTANQAHVTHIAPLNQVKFVGASGPGDGSPNTPYRNVEQALLFAADGTTLIFKAGTLNRFAAPKLVLNRRMTLRGSNATIRQ